MAYIASEEPRKITGFQRFQKFLGTCPATWKIKLNSPKCDSTIKWFCCIQWTRKRTRSDLIPSVYSVTVLHMGKKENNSSHTQSKSMLFFLDALLCLPELVLNTAVIQMSQLPQASWALWKLQTNALELQVFVDNPANFWLTI